MQVIKKIAVLMSFCLISLVSVAVAAPMQAQASKTQQAKSQQQAKEVVLLAQRVIQGVYNYDYKNYKAKLSDASRGFTKPGWQAFMSALTKSGNLKAVKDKKLTVMGKQLGPSRIVTKRIISGVPVWIVQLPYRAIYRNPKGQTVMQNLAISVAVSQQKQKNGSYKLGVTRVLARVVPSRQQRRAAKPAMQAPTKK